MKSNRELQPSVEKHWWLSFRGFIAFIFIIAIGYYLLVEHQAHLFNILPLLLLLACPFMHIFMHGNMECTEATITTIKKMIMTLLKNKAEYGTC